MESTKISLMVIITLLTTSILFFNCSDDGDSSPSVSTSTNISTNSITPNTYQWDYTKGGAGNDRSYSIISDSNGYIYVAGSFEGSVDFGGGSRVSGGGTDIFLVKLNSSGVYQWDYTKGGTDNDLAYGVNTDSSGNVYITGSFRGSVNFGGGSRAKGNQDDIFLVKLNSSGTYQWDYTVGGDNIEYGIDVNIDSSGNVYLFGEQNGIINFGGGERYILANTDVFIVKLNNSGQYQWDFITGYGVSNGGFCIDNNSNIYITGMFIENNTFGGNIINSIEDGFFVVKLNNSGQYQWNYIKNAKLLKTDPKFKINVDINNNIYVAGYFYNTINFGGGDRISTDSISIFVVKLNNSGQYQWDYTNKLDVKGDTETFGIDINSSGNIYITGSYYETVDFGGGSRNSNGTYDIFVVKLNNDGKYQWDYTKGNSGADESTGICLYDNYIYITGYFSNTIDFGGGVRTSAGNSDIFILKLRQ